LGQDFQEQAHEGKACHDTRYHSGRLCGTLRAKGDPREKPQQRERKQIDLEHILIIVGGSVVGECP
jgi:hypothetical protein